MWDNGYIWEGVKQGKLQLSACGNCQALCHPPLPMCPACQSMQWQAKTVSGRGVVLSWLSSSHPAQKTATVAPVVVVIALEEGVNFVSNLLGVSLEDVYEGMAVNFCCEELEGSVLPLFRPESGQWRAATRS